MLPENRQIELFDRTCNSSLGWIASAKNLRTAAEILRTERTRCHRDVLPKLQPGDRLPEGCLLVVWPDAMLFGFAVECLLKALWLERGNKLSIDGEYKGIPGANDHQLTDLAREVGFGVSENTKDMLRRLSRIMTSSGRYPVPRKWEYRKIRMLHGGGSGVPEYWLLPSDDMLLDELLQALDNELDK